MKDASTVIKKTVLASFFVLRGMKNLEELK